MGVMTLFFFDRQQYLAQASLDISTAASQTEVITFNLVVVLAYAMLVGILAWKCKNKFGSNH